MALLQGWALNVGRPDPVGGGATCALLDSARGGGLGDRSWKMGCPSSKMCLSPPCAATRVISICLQGFTGRVSGTNADPVWNQGEWEATLAAEASLMISATLWSRCGSPTSVVIPGRAFSESLEILYLLSSILVPGNLHPEERCLTIVFVCVDVCLLQICR